jgi:L-cysteine S-thiosulfotransferase
MKNNKLVMALGVAVVAGCAAVATKDAGVTDAQVKQVLQASFKSQGQATMDRLDQDDVQRLCSEAAASGKPLASDAAARLQQAQLATIKYPADGKLLGDWKEGEKIAQSGVGKQYSDDPGAVAGGNCYACHQLSKQELAYGTIGPSLYNFGKLRGNTPEMQKYAYGKVFNPDAYAACSSMPRFGQHQILTERQIKDVVALLLDPQSPVNK